MIESEAQEAALEIKPEYADIFEASLHVDLEFWSAGDQHRIRGEILSVGSEDITVNIRPEDYANNQVESGTPIAILYIQQGGSYRGECWVLKVEELPEIAKISVTKPTEVSRTQLRSSFRWETILEDCAIYQSSAADAENWQDYPLVVTNVSTGGVRGKSEVQLPVGPDAEEFNYVVEIGLPWDYGVITFPSNLLGADLGGTEESPEWNYRIQFVDPPATGQDAIARYINRSQMEMQESGSTGPTRISEKRAPTGGAQQIQAVPAETLSLDEVMSDASRPSQERAERLGQAAVELARDIVLSPQPENIKKAIPFVKEMVGHVAGDFDLLKGMVSTLSSSPDLYVHSVNVTVYSLALGTRVGYDESGNLDELATGAFLHDLGKSSISDAILLKGTQLSVADWEQIRRHPNSGRHLAARSGISSRIALDVIQHHHEHYGGLGYPDELAGKRISVESRIVAIADGFDALTSERPWRDRGETVERPWRDRGETVKTYSSHS